MPDPGPGWATFTRRTEDPKLGWIERRLDELGIPRRRRGRSFHAPILEVPAGRLAEAWAVLDEEVEHGGRTVRLDDVPDDDPRFLE